MNKKERWKDDVLNSLDDVQRAIPDEILLSQIMARLPENTLTMNLSRWQLRWVAVAACVLVVANIYVFNLENRTMITASKTETIALSEEAMTLFNDYSLYQ